MRCGCRKKNSTCGPGCKCGPSCSTSCISIQNSSSESVTIGENVVTSTKVEYSEIELSCAGDNLAALDDGDDYDNDDDDYNDDDYDDYDDFDYEER